MRYVVGNAFDVFGVSEQRGAAKRGRFGLGLAKVVTKIKGSLFMRNLKLFIASAALTLSTSMAFGELTSSSSDEWLCS